MHGIYLCYKIICCLSEILILLGILYLTVNKSMVCCISAPWLPRSYPQPGSWSLDSDAHTHRMPTNNSISSAHNGQATSLNPLPLFSMSPHPGSGPNPSHLHLSSRSHHQPAGKPWWLHLPSQSGSPSHQLHCHPHPQLSHHHFCPELLDRLPILLVFSLGP